MSSVLIQEEFTMDWPRSKSNFSLVAEELGSCPNSTCSQDNPGQFTSPLWICFLCIKPGGWSRSLLRTTLVLTVILWDFIVAIVTITQYDRAGLWVGHPCPCSVSLSSAHTRSLVPRPQPPLEIILVFLKQFYLEALGGSEAEALQAQHLQNKGTKSLAFQIIPNKPRAFFQKGSALVSKCPQQPSHTLWKMRGRGDND